MKLLNENTRGRVQCYESLYLSRRPNHWICKVWILDFDIHYHIGVPNLKTLQFIPSREICEFEFELFHHFSFDSLESLSIFIDLE